MFAGVTFVAFIALVAFEIRIAFQRILIQCDEDPFISISPYFLGLQAIAEVELEAADGHAADLCAGAIGPACHLATVVDIDGHIHDVLQLGHVYGVGERCAGSYTRDLAGMGAVAYGYGCPGRCPYFIRGRAVFLSQWIITGNPCFCFCHRSAAQGHTAIHGSIGIMTKDDCIGSFCLRIFIIGRTQDDIVLFVCQFVIVTQHQVGLVCIHTAASEGVVRTNDIIVLAFFHRIEETIYIVQLGGCAFCILFLFVIAGDSVTYAYHLCHIGARHCVAAAHDHDLAAAGGNGILQCILQCFRILQILHDGTGLLEIDGPVGICDAVSCTVDQDCVGIGGHIGLADDTVRHAAEVLGIFAVIINVECAIGQGCGAAEVIASRSSCFIHDTGEGTGHGGGDAAGIGHVPGGQSGKFLGPFVVSIGIGFEPVDDRHFSIVRFVDAVIFGFGVTAGPFQLSYVDGVRIFRTGSHVCDLTGHFRCCVAYGNGSCCGFPGTGGVAAVVLPFQVIAHGAFIGRRHGTIAHSHAPIFLDVGVMAQEDGVGNLRRQCLIRRTDGNVVLHILVHGVVVTDDDQVVAFLGFGMITLAQNAIFCTCRERLPQNCVIGTNHIGIVSIGDFVVVAINHIVLAAVFIDFRAP